MTALWVGLLVASVGSYLTKLAGLSLPASVLARPAVQRVAGYLPVAMLSALVAVQLFSHGSRYTADWRTLVGVGVAVVALLLGQGFLVVLLSAVAVTALLRLLT